MLGRSLSRVGAGHSVGARPALRRAAAGGAILRNLRCRVASSPSNLPPPAVRHPLGASRVPGGAPGSCAASLRPPALPFLRAYLQETRDDSRGFSFGNKGALPRFSSRVSDKRWLKLWGDIDRNSDRFLTLDYRSNDPSFSGLRFFLCLFDRSRVPVVLTFPVKTLCGNP